jgi:hypothetical protein
MNPLKSSFIVILLLLPTSNFSFAQTITNQSCKIEFYLLKSVIPNADKTTEIRAKFDATPADLEEKAFINDADIISCTVNKDTAKAFSMSFKVSDSAAKRIKDLDRPLCCGKQFAVVVNGKICFTGYFWNIMSSFGCDWITAITGENSIMLIPKLPPDGSSKPDVNELRENRLLLDCLASTNRLVEK